MYQLTLIGVQFQALKMLLAYAPIGRDLVPYATVEQVSAVDGDLATPLHLAAAEGWLDCVQLLVEAKAPLEASDNDGSTPLTTAAKGGSNEVCALLIQRANVNHSMNCGKTALHLVAEEGHEEVANLVSQCG